MSHLDHQLLLAALKDELDDVKRAVKQVVSLQNELEKNRKKMSKRKVENAAKVKQANDDRVFNLLMKRKQLLDAGFPACEIDDQLPLPGNDEDEPPAKKRRLVVCKKEEPE
jgi:regulator of replication initiation timing